MAISNSVFVPARVLESVPNAFIAMGASLPWLAFVQAGIFLIMAVVLIWGLHRRGLSFATFVVGIIAACALYDPSVVFVVLLNIALGVLALAVFVYRGAKVSKARAHEALLREAHVRVTMGRNLARVDRALQMQAMAAYTELRTWRWAGLNGFDDATRHSDALALALAFDGFALLDAVTEARAFLDSQTMLREATA